MTVDRARQRVACQAHESQALPTSVLWRRLGLLGDTESLRWLRPAGVQWGARQLTWPVRAKLGGPLEVTP